MRESGKREREIVREIERERERGRRKPERERERERQILIDRERARERERGVQWQPTATTVSLARPNGQSVLQHDRTTNLDIDCIINCYCLTLLFMLEQN